MRWIALALIRVYQLLVSPLLGPCCRFSPSCSTYTATCIDRFGPLRGVWLGMRRLARCHPFGGSGYDPPPLESDVSSKNVTKEASWIPRF